MSAPTQAAASSSAAAAAAHRPMMLAPAHGPLFEYKRPPLASLDPMRTEDSVRIVCLAFHILRANGAHGSQLLSLPTVNTDMDLHIITVRTYRHEEVAKALQPYLVAGWTCTGHSTDMWVNHTIADAMNIHAALAALARAQGHTASMVAGKMYSETWPDWDILVPTRALTRHELQNPPAKSILRLPEAQEILAIWERVGPRGPTFTLGPSPGERMQMWDTSALQRKLYLERTDLAEYNEEMKVLSGEKLAAHQRDREKTLNRIAILEGQIQRAEETRRRLAAHLAALPGVIIDMAHDPMCPWKGMKFFHGTHNPKLQQEVVVEPSAPAPHPSRYPCNLSWGEWTDSEGVKRKGSAFLSPYYTKGFSYGGATPHIYIYTLRKDGKELCFLDLRNDYVESTFKHDHFDPFKPIWELSGIPHAEDPEFIKLRDQKARNLYNLFHDAQIDGAVMNADVEFIFFHPADLLDWVVPVRRLDRILINTHEHLADAPQRLKDQAKSLVNQVAKLITLDKVEDLVRDKTLVHERLIQMSDLPIARWSLDTSYRTYISQFAVNRPTKSQLWTEHQHIPAEPDDEEEVQRQTLIVLECDYYKLWRHFAPNGEFDDIWMADAITEGGKSGISRKTPLAYHQLCEILRAKFSDFHLLVHLPNGFVQIVPTLQTYELDPRLHHVALNPYYVTPQDKDRDWSTPLPRRDYWKPAATVGSLISSFLQATAAAGGKRKDPASSASKEEEEEDAERTKIAKVGHKLCIV